MTQHSLKISVSYFCTDKNDLIMGVCLCYYLFIYLLFFYWYFWLWDQTLLSVKTSVPFSLHPTTFSQIHQGMPKFNSGLSFTSQRGHQTNVCCLIIPVKPAEMTMRCITPIDDLVLALSSGIGSFISLLWLLVALENNEYFI